MHKVGTDTVVFVDVRDLHELEKDGTISGAVHASRGSLEFLIDPQSPAHINTLARDTNFIVFCASGMRSLLAAHTMIEMGMKNVTNLEGGFNAWRKENGPIASVAK